VARRKRKQAEPVDAAPWAHLRGLGMAMLLTAVFLVAITVLVSITPLTEAAARWLMAGCCAVALFVGSSHTGKRLGRSGWLNGAVTGLVYVALLLLLAVLLDLGLTAGSLITLAMGFAVGAAGGVAGVNRR